MAWLGRNCQKRKYVEVASGVIVEQLKQHFDQLIVWLEAVHIVVLDLTDKKCSGFDAKLRACEKRQ